MMGPAPSSDLVGVQRTGLSSGKVQHQSAAGSPRLRSARAGLEDGAHIGGAEPPELHRPAQRVDQSLLAVSSAESEQNVQLGGQPGVADRRSTDEELLGLRAEGTELFFRLGFRPGSARRRGAGSVVMRIEDRHLTGADQLVLGDDHPGRRFQHDQGTAIDHDGHRGARQPLGHREAGRAVPDTRQAVHLAAHRSRPDLQPQRRQCFQDAAFLMPTP